MTIRFTPTAEAKLLNVVAYLLDENSTAAWPFHDRALETISVSASIPIQAG
jgi:plasmid stabilization system protein ParE